jgi:hypothetical protein
VVTVAVVVVVVVWGEAQGLAAATAGAGRGVATEHLRASQTTCKQKHIYSDFSWSGEGQRGWLLQLLVEAQG